MTAEVQPSIARRKQPLRVLALLDSLERALVARVTLRLIHELSYLANVLAPVFELAPQSASLLKRRGGPYYPEMQRTLDLLVGKGMVFAFDLQYVHVPEETRYRLDARYELNRALAQPPIERYRQIYSDTDEIVFIDQLALAYSTLADEQLGRATPYDARYAHSDVDVNNVIDFGEWVPETRANFSANAALTFAPDLQLRPSERLYLYIAHLKKRALSA